MQLIFREKYGNIKSNMKKNLTEVHDGVRICGCKYR